MKSSYKAMLLILCFSAIEMSLSIKKISLKKEKDECQSLCLGCIPTLTQQEGGLCRVPRNSGFGLWYGTNFNVHPAFYLWFLCSWEPFHTQFHILCSLHSGVIPVSHTWFYQALLRNRYCLGIKPGLSIRTHSLHCSPAKIQAEMCMST